MAGRYCSYADVLARFRKITDVGSTGALSAEAQINSHYILYAENQLDSMLGRFFTAPFSSNNQTARDLAIDLTYAKFVRYADAKLYESIMKGVTQQVDDLIAGRAVMLTTSGDQLATSAPGNVAWSNTMSYAPAFGMDDELWLGVGSAQLTDEFEARYP